MQASVFISATNADYQAAREVYQFLTDRGVICFFCDESLLRIGEKKYRDAVDRALEAARHLVVVSSSREHAESEWVKYAWSRLVREKTAGRTQKTLITVLCNGLEPANLPGVLRRSRILTFPAQLESLHRSLTTLGAAAGSLEDLRPTAAPASGRLTRRTLVLVTACNVLILGAMIWLLQRHGIAFLSAESPAPGGSIAEAGRGPDAGRVSNRDNPDDRRERNDPDPSIARGRTGDSATGLPGVNSPPSINNGSQRTLAEGTPVNLWDKPEAGTPCILEFGDRVNAAFCFIPHGTFLMGSPLDEAGRDGDESQHSVTISKDFWMARYECTRELWRNVMPSDPGIFKAHPLLPVESVSWTEVAGEGESFLAAINAKHPLPPGWRFALPTEAQWEYACRAGTSTPFNFGSILDGSQANCDGNLPYGTMQPGPYLGRPAKAGSYPPNAWGLCDMHGNVWEWCADGYESTLNEGINPLTTSGAARVQRGGSWHFNAALCRSASRQGVNPDVGDDTLGFRLAIVSSK